jgi:hypothetical protein
MRRLAASVLVAAVLVPASAAFADSSLRSGGGPFVLSGAFQGGASSGFWGDRSSARTGDELGCRARRHYSFAVVVRNRSARAVTVTGVSGPNPLPHVVARVAMQVRHAPSPQTGDAPQAPLIKHWSAVPARPVTIKPGRSAIVQSNFLMRHCDALGRNRKVVVPGSLVLSYRMSGRFEQEHVVQQNAGFTVVPGPIVRSCGRVPGSVSLVSYNIGCAAARDAAPACHHMPHGTWGSCRAAGRKWDCDLHSSWVQQCFFPDRTSRWYRVRWIREPNASG